MADTPVQDPTRRDFLYLATGAMAAVGTAAVLIPFVAQMNPDASVQALATTEVDLSAVQAGQSITVLWRGKPVFVRHRTPQEIAAAVKDDNSGGLKDPAKDADRHLAGKPEWMVLVGTCTHLGCVPTFGGGDFGGWLCPCHYSHYDTSGRIRKGPAPKNLAVPEGLALVSANTIKIG